jgi:hypothetical protein
MIAKLRSAEAWLTPFLALKFEIEACSRRDVLAIARIAAIQPDACERGCAEMENRTGRHGELHVAVLQRRPPR